MRHSVAQDVERLIKFMTHEAKQKIDELQIKANEEYLKEYNKLMIEETAALAKQYHNEVKKLQNSKTITQGSLLRKNKLIFLTEKSKIVDNYFHKSAEILKNTKLTIKLIKITPQLDTIYCKRRDFELVKQHYNCEVREMDESFLGGIISVSKDNRQIYDNSYLTRLDLAKEKCMEFIAGYLFKDAA